MHLCVFNLGTTQTRLYRSFLTSSCFLFVHSGFRVRELRELLSSVQMMFMRLNPLSHSAVLTGKDTTKLMNRCIGPMTEAHRRSYRFMNALVSVIDIM